jgi:3-deoxy-D-manno-octulosonic acid kinase
VTGSDPALPRGYVTVRARCGSGTFEEAYARTLATVLERHTLHDWARTVPDATVYSGRLPAYGVSLSQPPARVVVRHATHGGMLAPFTRDRFVGNGRALYEIRVSHALRERGVSTPRVIGFARYAAAAFLSRLDVVSEEVPDARDLVASLASGRDERRPMLEAIARLLVALARAEAHHADLNLKNVLLTGSASSPVAVLLDVDRVSLGVARAEAMRRNLTRLARSARKWRASGGPNLTENDLQWLAARARDLAP